MLIFLMMVLGVMAFGWSGRGTTRRYSENEEGKLSVVTAFYPLFFLTSEIGGDKVLVKNITPAGSEPHDYEPTARDIAEIQESRLLVLNGNGLEAWAEKIKDEITRTGVMVIESGSGLFEGSDPHIWLSPELAKKQAKTILAGLVLVDPENTAYYQDRERKLAEEIEKLQIEFREGLASCKKREIITSHDAFAYLADEFGLTQVAIAGISADVEPSTKQMAEVVRVAKEKEVRYIFFESMVSPKLSETVAEEVGAKTLVLDPLEGIGESDMEKGRNYLTVMRDNLANLQIALECQ